MGTSEKSGASIERRETSTAMKTIESALRADMRNAVETVKQQERVFHRVSGARDAVAVLYRMGALDDSMEASVGEWLAAGGLADLAIDGVSVVPPSNGGRVS